MYILRFHCRQLGLCRPKSSGQLIVARARPSALPMMSLIRYLLPSCPYIYMYILMYMYICILCMYVCMYVCTYVYILTYTHEQRLCGSCYAIGELN